LLDSKNKKLIDELCNTLVSKFPVPQDQVDQITVALTYKFMCDMDEESVLLGGNKSFFKNEWEKYDWKFLFDSKTSGEQRKNIYKHVIENLELNPNLPELFRKIFSKPPSPLSDTKALTKFLKTINSFSYENSETLGNAYEYLLSKTGAQGKLGQFRTPRHIIDFIVEILKPTSKDRIMDPSCGTAGFLVSAYKYIKENEKHLDSDELLSLSNNLEGFDIEPKMVRTSLLNLFLQGFSTPKIFEYDLLSEDSNWNEYYDLFLANPPFNPQGEIDIHKGFTLKTPRAEVHFVDYMNNHLTPDGKAGIIVPEGILYRKDNAYKYLRKKLLDESLIGIISLPPGVFKPYTGQKTSILFLDKKIAKNKETIFFGAIKNDGFSLNDNRNPIDKNDLPKILEALVDPNTPNDFVEEKLKTEIYEHPILSLSFITDDGLDDLFNSDFEMHKLEDIASVNAGNSAPQDKKYFENGSVNFVRTSDVAIINFGKIDETRDLLNEKGAKGMKLFPKGSILMPKSGASTLKNYKVMLKKDCYVVSHLAVIKANNEKVLDEYLLYIMKKIDALEYINDPTKPSLNLDKIRSIKIPVPSLEVQKTHLYELESYQEIINGCKKIIDNFRPSIDIDPKWKTVLLGEVATTQYGTSKKSKEKGKVPVLRMGNLFNGEIDYEDLVYSDNDEDIHKYNLEKNDILFNRTNSPELVGKTSIFRGYKTPVIFAGYLVRVTANPQIILPEYLNAILNSNHGIRLNNKNVSISGNQANINATKLKGYPIPLPDLSTQNEIVEKLKQERKIVNANKELIQIYKNKIEDRIEKVWGNK